MSAATLREQFGDDFSKSAFQVIDGELRIIGKYGQITQDQDGTFDVFFIGPDYEPLSERRLGALAKSYAQEGGFHHLTGEGWVKGRGRAFALKSALLAGVKKKRRISPEQRAKLAAQLQAARELAA